VVQKQDFNVVLLSENLLVGVSRPLIRDVSNYRVGAIKYPHNYSPS